MIEAERTTRTNHGGGNQLGAAEGKPERGDVLESRSANQAGARAYREGLTSILREVESRERVLSNRLSRSDLCVKMLSKQNT